MGNKGEVASEKEDIASHIPLRDQAGLPDRAALRTHFKLPLERGGRFSGSGTGQGESLLWTKGLVNLRPLLPSEILLVRLPGSKSER